MEEQEQSLPLLEKDVLDSSVPSKSRYSLLSSRFFRTGFVAVLCVYSLFVTVIVLVQNLPEGRTIAPYCKKFISMA
jgi:hypothetical protein